MFIHESGLITDVYPFVDSSQELPSMRISVFTTGSGKQVDFNGERYTREDFTKLVAGFERAFEIAEQPPEEVASRL